MGKPSLSDNFSNDDGDSQEELDVGQSALLDQGTIINGIRYSARVQEKQEKLRRETSPSKQIILETPSTSTIPLPSQSQVVAEEVQDEPPILSGFISCSLGEKKKKRTWELWSSEDKQLFFEALNEFGKDFEAIQTYLASKIKPVRNKTSCPQQVPKNKDQVRHFYYRTWTKISKYLTFPKDMKKMCQELYGLINYGELRRKQWVLNVKTAVKLSELVERGTTTIKVRGKTLRIKTPVCRALKKLNQLEDTDQLRVPCKLCVELIPHDGNTWASVQGVSHNPRVKVFVPLQRTLASLILYFEERWKTSHSRLKEEFSLTMFGKPKNCLRFIPVKNHLNTPVFKFSEITSATKISLSSYVQNCLRKPDDNPIIWTAQHDDNYDENVPSPTLLDCDDDNDNNTCDEDVPPLQADNISTCEICNQTDEEGNNPEKLDKSKCTCGPTKANDPAGVVDCPSFDLETLARGWTAEEAKTLTVGEIYLILGKCDKLCFEYMWDKCEEEKIREERSRRLVDKLISVARHLKKRKTNRAKSSVNVVAPTAATTAAPAAIPTTPPITVDLPPRSHTQNQPICVNCSSQTESSNTDSLVIPPPPPPPPPVITTTTAAATPTNTINCTTDLLPNSLSNIIVSSTSACTILPPQIILTQVNPLVTTLPTTGQTTQVPKFRRPLLIPKPSIQDPSTNDISSNQTNAPKPFLDLPKGNRRIGRRPAWKQRVIVPRMLPLLPKPDTIPLSDISTTTIINISCAPLPEATTTVTHSTHTTPAIISSSNQPSTSQINSRQNSRTPLPLFDDTLDNLSLSSFMDISIPESTRFMASDLRFEDMECSNASIGSTMSGRITRDPSLLDTPKKQAGGDEAQLEIPSPNRLSSLDTSWPALNEQSSDLFMGGIFSSADTLRSSSEAIEGDGDLNFQSVIGDNSLDFETKLRDFSVHITDSNKK